MLLFEKINICCELEKMYSSLKNASIASAIWSESPVDSLSWNIQIYIIWSENFRVFDHLLYIFQSSLLFWLSSPWLTCTFQWNATGALLSPLLLTTKQIFLCSMGGSYAHVLKNTPHIVLHYQIVTYVLHSLCHQIILYFHSVF